MRTRKKKWTAGELENNPLILHDTSALAGVLNDRREVHLELGCGKGSFITEMARRNPGILYIGIERDPTILAAAARLALNAEASGTDDDGEGVIGELPLDECGDTFGKPFTDETGGASDIPLMDERGDTFGKPLFLVAEADTLTDIFEPSSIARLYINFCDPWPNRKKWAKRRLTHGNYVSRYEQLLIPEIFFKTDNRKLFEFSIESLSERGWKLRNVSADLHADNMPDNVMTEYERKFSSKGMPIYRLEAYRV
jgi:tRNA (guanine-N7-)-methyltransferase